VNAVKIIKHLRNQPLSKRKKQRQIAESLGLTQSQISRNLSILTYVGIVEHDGDAYVEGPKSEKYLADWAVYLLDR
jgi:DNA-binding IclR family transcriptional regulator